MERIGVYICECGPNIKEALDVGKVVSFAQTLDNVVLARSFGLLCSEEGKAFIGAQIKEHRLTRLVFAACSPKEHEITFRNILKDAGLNPFLMQIANIREQCAWVTKDKAAATDKAKAIVDAAVQRVVFHEPLQVRQIECQANVLVVGAGIAGINAALTLSQKNRKVYVIEKSACIGGKTARYEDLYPSLECAACVLDPLLDQALHDEHIEIFTLSEVQQVLGYYGNFTIKVKKRTRFVNPDTCLGCGLCFDVCPVTVKNEFNEYLNDRKAIYIPYAGALPNVALIDKRHCLRLTGHACDACRKVCPFNCIDFDKTDRIVELNVGAVVLATGFDLFDPGKAPQYGYGRIENVYTSLEFERLLSSTGPTGGEIILKDGSQPAKIALMHCVGSRSESFNEHCSGICCVYLLKFAYQIRQKLPETTISMVYSDFCLPGKSAQAFFNKVSQNGGVKFYRTGAPDAVRIKEKSGKILIQYTGASNDSLEVAVDMVVLAGAIEGAKDARALADMFDVPIGPEGFFTEENSMLAAVSTLKDGVFIAGCAQGPMGIQDAAAQGQAAAGRILQRLIPGEKLDVEAITAEIDQDLCSGCKMCLDTCDFRAIAGDDPDRPVLINEVLCRGCGVCVAACPSGAIKAKHFTDGQVCAEINGLVQGRKKTGNRK